MKPTIAASIMTSLLFSGMLCYGYARPESEEYSAAMACLAKKGEVYFSFPLTRFSLDPRKQIETLTEIISIDNYKDGVVYAYANAEGFRSFQGYGLNYQVLTHPGDLCKNPRMAATPEELRAGWDSYPTYPAYVDMMNKFAADFPDKCRIIQIGTSGLNRKLLYAKISDRVNETEAEPRVMFTSSMHGDETTMYVNMLRMIDYLLRNYSTNAFIKKLVDTLEIWICPLENPDGTYKSGDNTVEGSVRYTSNGIDLNRHYPNFSKGAHPDKATKYEPECAAVMKLVDSLQFVVSVNFHGGAQLLNYPYDTRAALHEYDAWMMHVYKKYVDTVHAVNPNYMTDQGGGVTNGYAWYQVCGSRMDYITYSKFGREVTAEVATARTTPPSDLPNYWNYNYKSQLQYMEQALFGINGKVVDSRTKQGLRAKVWVRNLDKDSSFTIAKLPFGDYWRPIHAGTFTVEFSCPGYTAKSVSSIAVQNNKATVVDVELVSVVGVAPENAEPRLRRGIAVTSRRDGAVVSLGFAPAAVTVYSAAGAVVRALPAAPRRELFWDYRDAAGRTVTNGLYCIKAAFRNSCETMGIVVSR